ncbi:uncharacterized protein TRAVEDRAFT_49331 [Trametes versicolor FP-101664 SS1]|uniref:uncharacterized protein n=1 Tax=Trametes versicolor (strain FP-101664) TaxID=717944 RepID=UPI00046238FB|nr:uncharacterized protein TRAVEDRAFT_49331 [Trametes versicolor FP-101664 SS1]EIW56503.1 hypothetical protein TRAVEDRAFT_49331 [Trametes versicolor FP-101664 SS1]
MAVSDRDPRVLEGLRLMRLGLPNMADKFFERNRAMPAAVSYVIDNTGLTGTISKHGYTKSVNYEMIHYIIAFERDGHDILPTLNGYIHGQNSVNTNRHTFGLLLDHFRTTPQSIKTKDM